MSGVRFVRLRPQHKSVMIIAGILAPLIIVGVPGAYLFILCRAYVATEEALSVVVFVRRAATAKAASL